MEKAITSILKHLSENCTSKDIKVTIQSISSDISKSNDTSIREKIKTLKFSLNLITKLIINNLDRKSWAKGLIKPSSIKSTKQDLSKIYQELQCSLTILQISIYSFFTPNPASDRKLVIWINDKPDSYTSEIKKLSKSGIEFVQVTSNDEVLSTIKKNIEFIKNSPKSTRIITSFNSGDKGTENLIKSIQKMQLGILILIYSKNKDESLKLISKYPSILFTWKKSLLTIFCESLLSDDKKKYVLKTDFFTSLFLI